jgi:hypothetical protein
MIPQNFLNENLFIIKKLSGKIYLPSRNSHGKHVYSHGKRLIIKKRSAI